ncbi:MAG: hypothetical protein SPK70_02650 [Succinivibrio dextrinosolvens]|nr:hypothetical protein [Succinivibrio dextrinosolvens]MDY6469949.1 hypothetical protein [Succinivibrio dextrinosolvens]
MNKENGSITSSKAHLFFDNFTNLAEENIKLDIYKFKKGAKKFTNKITELISNVISGLTILDEKDESQKEYYRIDVIGYSFLDEDDKGFEEAKADLSQAPSLWSLDVAVEHENNHKGWKDELVKLCYIRCPLRVVIGYNYYDMRDDPKIGDVQKVKYSMELISQICSKTNSSVIENGQELLIILGNCQSKDGQGNYKDFDYRGYIIYNEAGKLNYKIIPSNRDKGA